LAINFPLPTPGTQSPYTPPTSLLPQGGPRAVADSSIQPDAYNSANNVEVRYAPQSNGVTKPVDTVVTGPTRVLESSERLLEGWRTAAGAPSTEPSASTSAGGWIGAALAAVPTGPPPDPNLTQVENDVVRINHPSKQPLAYLDNGELEGDSQITSPFVTANQVHQTVESDLGRDVRYRSEDGRLNINVGATAQGPDPSPFHTPNTGTLTFPASSSGKNLAADPDVVSHEQGHAILNSQRPDIDFSPESKATHEAFSDGVAFFNSLNQSEVQADTIRRWDNPTTPQSGLASNISEAGHAYFGGQSNDPRTGLRDLAGGAPSGNLQEHGHHKDSVKFGSAVHDSTRDVYRDIRQNNPDLSPQEALTQATDRVRSDFYRSLDFLPPGGQVTQDDLAAAMMRANSIDDKGQQRELYGRNFEEAGLRPVTGDRIAQEAGIGALGETVSLPEGLRQQNYESHSGQPDSPVRQQAVDFVAQHGAKLGIPSNYEMNPSRVYSNDRGETFMLFDGGKRGEFGGTREFLGLGFDSSGGLIHFDSAQQAPPPMPSFPTGGFPPGGLPPFLPTTGGPPSGNSLPTTGFPGYGPPANGNSTQPPLGGSGNDHRH
jgi:hypothetical protein